MLPEWERQANQTHGRISGPVFQAPRNSVSRVSAWLRLAADGHLIRDYSCTAAGLLGDRARHLDAHGRHH